jgi:hypothetical protein
VNRGLNKLKATSERLQNPPEGRGTGLTAHEGRKQADRDNSLEEKETVTKAQQNPQRSLGGRGATEEEQQWLGMRRPEKRRKK